MPFFFFSSHKYLEHKAGAELRSRAHFSAKGTLFYGLLDICLPALKILQSECAIFPEICFFTKNPDLFLMSHRNYREPRVVALVANSPLRALPTRVFSLLLLFAQQLPLFGLLPDRHTY